MSARLPLVQGTLDVLVPKAVSWGPIHGYGVSRLIDEKSAGRLVVDDAALYQALHRLARQDHVCASWGVSDNNRRARFYELTARGRARLASELDWWSQYASAMHRVLGTA
jgi:transcriptional regulator